MGKILAKIKSNGYNFLLLILLEIKNQVFQNFMRIIIAEDDVMSARILEIFFVKQGIKVSITTNGEDALALLKTHHFDVLLTDWMMPKMDGIELIRQVKASICPLPIIIMFTAVSSQNSKKTLLNLGINDYIVKPYKPVDVLDCIKKFFPS